MAIWRTYSCTYNVDLFTNQKKKSSGISMRVEKKGMVIFGHLTGQFLKVSYVFDVLFLF